MKAPAQNSGCICYYKYSLIVDVHNDDGFECSDK